MVVAAHFMVGALIKIHRHEQANSCVITATMSRGQRVEDNAFHLRFQFAILGFRIFFHADATVRLPCPQFPGRPR